MKVNLRYGVKHDMSRTGSEKDTCTACAGSMLLEFSALSRLTGNTAFEVCVVVVVVVVVVAAAAGLVVVVAVVVVVS